MMRLNIKFAIALLATVAVGVAFAQTDAKPAEKVRLKRIFKEGTTRKYKNDIVANPEEGQEYTAQIVMENEEKVVKVGSDGNASYESKQISFKLTVNDQEMNMPDMPDQVDKSVMTPQNEVISLDSPQDPDFSKRVVRAWSVFYPANEISVGDAWAHEYKADKDKGWRGGNATETLLGIETVNGVKTAKVKHTYTEKPFDGDSGSIKATGTMWIDLSNGELVKMEGAGTGVPNPQGSGSGTMKMTMKMAYVPAK